MYDIDTMREKTNRLQRVFICPIWAVWFGSSVKLYFSAYHAEQMMRALRLNGTQAHCFEGDVRIAEKLVAEHPCSNRIT